MANGTTANRPPFVRDSLQTTFGVVQKPLTIWERIYSQGWLRKSVLLLALALIWEVYARQLDNPLLFPTFSATFRPWQTVS
jgi:NitT/TauT family transport system permease protein